MPIAADVLEKLKRKHGTIHVLQAAGEEVVVRQPTRADWHTFRRLGMDKKKRHLAAETFIRLCVVHPDTPTFEATLERKAAVADSLIEALLTLVGVDPDAKGYTVWPD